ncbi:hypothetical protein F4824DRAFT_360105 [Ustulina deusta]|nr:hypothetical protein F4824DRAFT_360105 [Ustulina deusta]
MLAMTRLPSDTFLPSGGIDSFDRSISHIPHLNAQPGSVISPLSLARSIKQPYFDISPSDHVSPLSLSATPGSRQYLSPEHNSLSTPTRGTPGSSIASPSMGPTNPGAMSPFEHLSPQVAAALLQRREEHCRRLRESWQAERAHLEASRARAEEMFREERNIMDEERLIWAEQKSELENEIVKWKQSKEAVEAEVTKLTKLLKITSRGEGRLGGNLDGVAHEIVGKGRQSSSVGPKIGSTSTPTYRTPSDGISPSGLPRGRVSTIPESNPFVPLDPRMQSVSPSNMAMRKEKERVPSIDINEIMPGLEGVRLRAPAIQKSTFNDGKPPSPTVAPGRVPPSEPEKSSPESQSKVSPALMTQETLKAPEHRRLTMHAGHTPNHSMSLSQLPTVESTAGNTASSSGSSTPTSLNEPRLAHVDEARKQSKSAAMPDANQESYAAQGLCDSEVIPEEVIFEPSDEDPALKGPLCLKNRPAADEMFLRRLSDKLEEVKATDATPSVLNESVISGPTEDMMDPMANRCADDHTRDNHPDDGLEGLEEDVPLRFKTSNNFGQPLGQIRRTSGF